MSEQKVDKPFYCSDLEAIGGDFHCCSSCHEDWEEYDYCLSEPERGGLNFRVCCTASEMVSDATPEEWEILKTKLLALRQQNQKTGDV